MPCANETINIAGKPECNATTYKKCKGEQCAFYISTEQAAATREKCHERLNTLSAEEQSGISEKYYDGKMPWKKRMSWVIG